MTESQLRCHIIG